MLYKKLMPYIYAGRPHSFITLFIISIVYYISHNNFLNKINFLIIFNTLFGAIFGNSLNGYIDWYSDIKSDRKNKNKKLYYWEQVVNNRSEYLITSIISLSFYILISLFMPLYIRIYVLFNILIIFLYTIYFKHTIFKEFITGIYICSPLFIIDWIKFGILDIYSLMIWFLFQIKTEYIYNTFDSKKINYIINDNILLVLSLFFVYLKFDYKITIFCLLFLLVNKNKKNKLVLADDININVKKDLLLMIILSIISFKKRVIY